MNSPVQRINGSNGGNSGSSVQNSKTNQRRTPSPTPSTSSSYSTSSGYSSIDQCSPNSRIYESTPPSPLSGGIGYQITRKVESHSTKGATHEINHSRAFVPYAAAAGRSNMFIKMTSDVTRVRINAYNSIPNSVTPPSPGQRTPRTPYSRTDFQDLGYNGSEESSNESSSVGDSDSRWLNFLKK